MVNQHMEDKVLKDYAMPFINGATISIRRRVFLVTHFNIKITSIQMIQDTTQFNGLSQEDLNWHITNFQEICDTFKQTDIIDDAIRLRLFPLSFKDKEKMQLNSLAPCTITAWEELVQKFLKKYFPPTKTAKLRNDIATFTQWDNDPLYEAQEHFKDLLKKCPHHEFPIQLQIQTFYKLLTIQ